MFHVNVLVQILRLYFIENIIIIFVSLSVCVSVLGECPPQDVQTLGLHGHDGSGKTQHISLMLNLQLCR